MKPFEPCLVLLDPESGEVRAVHLLAEGVTRIGRSWRSTIPIRDRTVSRFHCYLERTGMEVRIFDAGSRNSTWVGTVPAEGQLLREGDVIRLGRVRLRYHERPPALQSTTAVPEAGGERPAGEDSPCDRDSGRRGSAASGNGAPASGRRSPPGPPPGAAAPGSGARAPAASAPVETERVPITWTAPQSRRLRRRRTASKGRLRRFEVLALFAVVLALGGLSLLVLRRGSQRVAEDGDAAGLSARERSLLVARLKEAEAELARERERLRALEKRLRESLASGAGGGGALERELEAYGREFRAVSRRAEEIRRERAELARKLDAPSGPQDGLYAIPPQPEPPGSPEAGDVSLDGPGEETGSGRESGAAHRGRTEVRRVPPPRREVLPKARIDELVQALKAAVEEYGYPTTTPEVLEPHLGALAGAGGEDAARGLVEVYHHARDLLKEVDGNIRLLEARTQRLLKEAEAIRSRSKGGADRYAPPGSNPELERKQRALELSEKALEIKKDQRARLVALHDRVLEALSRFDDPAAAPYLAVHFGKDRQEKSEALALLEAIRRAGNPEAVPILARHLLVRDPDIAKALRETLAALAGHDLGPRRSDWEAWWEARKGGKVLDSRSPGG